MNNNKKMNPVFSLKNFRSFGEDGADFELAPITVLTGCNSAGKSSMTKALMLLSKLPHEKETIHTALKLYSKDLDLGNFKKVLHKQANSNEIEISYKIWSNYLQEEVYVRRYFKSKKADTLNDGHLCRYTIEKIDGSIILEKDTTPRGIGNKKIYKENITQNFNNFSLASQYLKLIRGIEVFKKDLYKKYENTSVALRLTRDLENTRKQLEENKINIEDYNIKLLNNWYEWIDKRNSDIEEWKKYCKTDEEMEEMMDKYFPKGIIIEHFFELVTNEVYSPWFTCNVKYIDSNSAAIRRSYSVENDNKMSHALCVFNSMRVTFEEHFDVLSADPYYHKPGGFMNRWLGKERFNLGKVSVEGDEEGGVKIYLKKEKEYRLLADEGYGITQLVSLLLLIDNAIKSPDIKNIENEIEIPWYKGKPHKGYWNKPKQIICVEEPEIHLHPKYQSLLADMFVEAFQKYNIHFIIETHSEYLIRKLQVMVADKENVLMPNDISLNYVEKDEEGISHNRQIKVLEDGRLNEPFGPGFFDEATDLSMRLLKMKMEAK